jgi:hypothetical protein
MTTAVPRKTTTAFFVQAGLSFSVAVLAWAGHATLVSRVEQARLDKLLTEHDRFKVPTG